MYVNIIILCFFLNIGLALAETFKVTGTIIDSQPVYKTKTINTPIQKCWNEDVPVYGQSQNNQFSVPGAIIGGIIGQNVTKNLPDGGTAGAIIGGLFGNKMNNQQITGYRTIQKCSTSYDTSTEEYLAGYKITYKAAGFTGTTTRTRNPGVGGNISVVIRMSAQ